MIEAVKSTLVLAPALQKVSSQTSTARGLSANPDQLQEVAPQTEGFYTSRTVSIDSQSKVAVLEFRNPLNGDVKTQIPTQAQLEAYEIAELQKIIANQIGLV